ncbi:MAG: XTP/dITP diphosphatase [Deltaproteobacteria bacterium]|nr:XTP/dITP diphosphatase [Deltaproteobacteria bacterium]
MMDVIVASRNPNKVEEIRQILTGSNLRIISMDDIPSLPDVREDGLTFEENARKKALEIAKLTGRLTLADDSGLVVDALNGRPGVYSARYSDPDATPEKNNAKLLEELREVPMKRRTARFVCVIAIARPSGKVDLAEGRCEGLIATELRGSQGFGYDPLFVIPEREMSFAELGTEEKNKISHRSIALQKAAKIILGLPEQEKG